MKRSIKHITITISAYLVAFLVQYYVIYRFLIIPQLPAIKSVPLLWWGGYMLPIIIVSILAGYLSKNLNEVITISLVVAIFYNLFIYYLAKYSAPGYMKAYEGDFLPTIVEGTLIYFIALLILLSIGYAGNKLFAVSRNIKNV